MLNKKIDSSHLAKVIISNLICILLVFISPSQQDGHNVVANRTGLERN